MERQDPFVTKHNLTNHPLGFLLTLASLACHILCWRKRRQKLERWQLNSWALGKEDLCVAYPLLLLLAVTLHRHQALSLAKRSCHQGVQVGCEGLRCQSQDSWNKTCMNPSIFGFAANNPRSALCWVIVQRKFAAGSAVYRFFGQPPSPKLHKWTSVLEPSHLSQIFDPLKWWENGSEWGCRRGLPCVVSHRRIWRSKLLVILPPMIFIQETRFLLRILKTAPWLVYIGK